MLEPPILDIWAPLNHKRPLGGTAVPGQSYLVPDWTGTHARRLKAYMILLAYLTNNARHFIDSTDDQERRERREYGDPEMLVSIVKAALLGEDVAVMVEGAEADPNVEPDADRLQARQDWLRDWATRERFPLKLDETETNAIGLGDGVYVLGYSTRLKRAKLRVYDPGHYFPVLDPDADDEFPTKVHIAWEEDRERDDSRRRIRRITWELVDATEEGPDGPVLAPYRPAYLAEGDDPATHTCLMTDAVFVLDGERRSVDDLSEATATYMVNEDGEQVNRLDLRMDFIPVVHVPNTVNIQGHFGKSLLSNPAQLLDDIQSVDTDLQASAGTTALPAIALSGQKADLKDLAVRPGAIFPVGDGKMDVLDTSAALDALLKYLERLLKRLAETMRVPEEVLGRVTSADAVAAIAMAMAFGPMRSLINGFRLARDEKYRLLFKFVQRLAILHGQLEGPVEEAFLAFGSYLPQDQSTGIANVIMLVDKKVISRRTGMVMLQELGVPIEDVDLELARVDAEDLEGAALLLEATDDPQLVRARLGIEGEPPTPEPEPTPPPPGPDVPTLDLPA